MVEGKVISTGNVAYCLGMSSKKLHRWYKEVLSGFKESVESGALYEHDIQISDPRYGVYNDIRVPIYKAEHIGEAMAIDEKQIDGVMYTILSNRTTGKIALMADTLKTKYLAELIYSFGNQENVLSYTRDMAANYDWLGRQVFFNAYHVIDKFHVVKLALDGLQAIRIRYRQEELKNRREQGKAYQEQIFSNGDSVLQLLARARGLLFKRVDEWTVHQLRRSELLFTNFPELKTAYKLIQKLRLWYVKIKATNTNTRTIKNAALHNWITQANISDISEMKNLAASLSRHSSQIVNYFIKNETNAKAEALNSRIQRFININYGARNTDFFLYRLNLYFS